MTRLIALFALLSVAFAAPRDRRQVFFSPPVAAPAIVGAQQTPGGHVTGASASITIHASPAIKTAIPVAALAVPVAPVAPTVLAADPAVQPPILLPPQAIFGEGPVLVPAQV